MIDVMERLSAKLVLTKNGCLEYSGYIRPNGYAALRVGGRGSKTEYVHRIVYMNHFGEISEKMTIDHLCRNRKCANIQHLEMVAHRENCIRAIPFNKRQVVHQEDHEPVWHKNGTNNGIPRRKCAVCVKRREA
jgi:hypothetical protein